ncbi:MAG: YifB family Mg chelatase-like AAA ATPase [Alphaproteobacteria bacterium]
MHARATTVAFAGLDIVDVDVQVHLGGGLPAFLLVGLPDKTIAESRERVRAALAAIGLALPARRITVNLSPADLHKEGSHYDLPIALSLMLPSGTLDPGPLGGVPALGALALDGRLRAVPGVLPAAVAAAQSGRGLVCPAESGPEAAWSDAAEIVAAPSLVSVVNHFKGVQRLAAPAPLAPARAADLPDLADVKGQEGARRALEVAAAGGHNLLFVGPPGAGKSMLARRLPGLLPPLEPAEALEVSMVHSLAGLLHGGGLVAARPFRDPHHSASVAALVGGGARGRPGEVSLAHGGVLFLDELPEFQRGALEALRQPLESGRAVVARANAHASYPARVQLVAACNPCRCGHLADPSRACGRAPRCGRDYLARLSGPLLDRIDMQVELAPVPPATLAAAPAAEPSAAVAARVARARERAAARGAALGLAPGRAAWNAMLDGRALEQAAQLDDQARALLARASERLKLSARGYHRVLRVARTLADLDGSTRLARAHVGEALAYRRSPGLES